ncbi:unnamed protein product, partial [Colletotrichum noveboracense]
PPSRRFMRGRRQRSFVTSRLPARTLLRPQARPAPSTSAVKSAKKSPSDPWPSPSAGAAAPALAPVRTSAARSRPSRPSCTHANTAALTPTAASSSARSRCPTEPSCSSRRRSRRWRSRDAGCGLRRTRKVGWPSAYQSTT